MVLSCFFFFLPDYRLTWPRFSTWTSLFTELIGTQASQGNSFTKCAHNWSFNVLKTNLRKIPFVITVHLNSVYHMKIGINHISAFSARIWNGCLIFNLVIRKQDMAHALWLWKDLFSVFSSVDMIWIRFHYSAWTGCETKRLSQE